MDFGRFLNNHITSKENSLASSSIFKSKESFSDLYTGNEWDLTLSFPKSVSNCKAFQSDFEKNQDSIPKVSSQSVDWDAVMATAEALAKDSSVSSFLPASPPKSTAFTDAFKSLDWCIPTDAIENDIDYTPDMLDAALFEPQVEKKTPAVFQSLDWVMTEILGSNEDISLSPDMFCHESHAPSNEKVEPSFKTDWSSIMFSQMAPSTPSVSAASAPKKKKRKRKKRKKVIPDHKAYVNIHDLDVLLGRGGRSNHHPGNKRYREEVTSFRRVYSTLQNDKEKTEMSQLLVDAIQKTGGRFLEEDKHAGVSAGWYVVPNIVARRKASQALREDDDPERRKAKRARYLARRNATETI